MLPEVHDRTTHFLFFEDFLKLDTALFASTDDSGTGTNLLLDLDGGWMSVVTAAADNDYHLMSTTKKLFKWETTKPLRFEARVSLTEANTDDANVIVGLIDTLTSGNLQDNGAGPAASYKGFCFFKVDGGTSWQFETSNGATQTTNTAIAAVSSGTPINLAFEVQAHPDGVNAIVTPEVDGVKKTPHLVAISGLSVAMYAAFGIKAGGANAETLNVDFIGVSKPR
jgi:hypothetical protein